MQYFTQEYIDFMTELAFNNEKSWFAANKSRFEKHVKQPFEKFAEDLITEIQKFDPDIKIDPKRAVYRIYRDVRFAKDKTPYKTYMGMGIGRQKNDYAFPGYTLGIGLDKGLSIAGGLYAPEKEQLTRIRQTLMDNPSEIEKVANDPDFKKLWTEVIGDKNKILPKEFKEATKINPWLAYKQWIYWKSVDINQITQDDLLEYVVSHFKVGYKLNQYFKQFSD